MSAEQLPPVQIKENGDNTSVKRKEILKKSRIEAAKFGVFMALVSSGAAALICSDDIKIKTIGAVIVIGASLYVFYPVGKEIFISKRGDGITKE